MRPDRETIFAAHVTSTAAELQLGRAELAAALCALFIAVCQTDNRDPEEALRGALKAIRTEP